jgi:type III restriction enzyme
MPLAGEGRGEGEINLIIEVTGENKKDKAAKVSTARTLWVPAINNHRGFGKWAFLEIADPWNAIIEIRKYMGQLKENPS